MGIGQELEVLCDMSKVNAARLTVETEDLCNSKFTQIVKACQKKLASALQLANL